MLALIQKLRRTRLLSAAGLWRLAEAVLTTGANPMALLRVAAKLHPGRLAVTDEREALSYAELWRQAESLAGALHEAHAVRPGRKVAIACRNHAAAVKVIFACSRLGADVFLINPELSAGQLRALGERLRLDFYVYDEALAPVFAEPGLSGPSLPAYHPVRSSIDRLASSGGGEKARLRRFKAGRIVVMTGGTTGEPKAASRKPSATAFLPPFIALLTRVHLDRYRKVHIATPMYHGFGLATLFVGVALGAEMYFTPRFDAERSGALIARHGIEVVTLVPLMLQRLLHHDAAALSSLRCVISGGAPLSPALVRESLARLRPTLFNLFGTSEGGFAIMATPAQLARKPESIGQPVRGVSARILDAADREAGGEAVGRLCLRSAWTTSREGWIDTGDLALRDAEGDIFLRGRVDDMVVSGGEKVYPVELENVLLQHPAVAAAAAVGIADLEFGQRLKAVVVAKPGGALDPETLRAWLKPRLARHQMPAVIEFLDELPCTPLGKLDRKALRAPAA